MLKSCFSLNRKGGQMKRFFRAALVAALILQLFFPAAPALAAEAAERGYPTAAGPAELVELASHWDGGAAAGEGGFASRRLVLFAPRLPDSFGAERVLSCPSCGEYVLQYATPEAAERACALFRSRYGESACWPDAPVRAQRESMSWGAGAMGMEGVLNAAYSFPGGATVAVMDSGCATGLPMFRGRISPYSFDFVSMTNWIDDWAENSEPGHGTAVCSLIADSTPANVELLVLRVFNRFGYASSLNFANAMLYALDCGADVVNMSIGVVDDADTEWDIPLRRLYEAGIPFVCSSGNDSANVSGIYPAYSPYTIAVSSIDEALNFSDYSNFGAAIDFCAPGDNLTALDSVTGGYILATGTSFSAPYIAAAAAYVKLLHPAYSVAQVYAALQSCCLDRGEPGRDTRYGWGMPLISAYLAAEQPGAADGLLYGPALYDGGIILLTDMAAEQRGMAAWNFPLDTSGGFEISLEYRADPGAYASGEGIGVMLTSTVGTPPGTALGGEGLNLRPDPDMVAVVLDSNRSDGWNGYGQYVGIVAGSAAALVADSQPCPYICDGNWHSLNISGTDGALAVAIDGALWVSAGGLSLPELAYLSVTGTTGSLYSRQCVRNISFTAVRPTFPAAQPEPVTQPAPEPEQVFRPLPSTGGGMSFVDVTEGAWYIEAVSWALEAGVTGGVAVGQFGPDRICTRAEAVTFLWRAAGAPEPAPGDMPFYDIPSGAYYDDAVRWAVQNGVTGGVGMGMFDPNGLCTRAQIVTFLWRIWGSSAFGLSPYLDVPWNAYYAAAVGWASETSVTMGTGEGLFSPDAECTRAQIVTFLYRVVLNTKNN